MKVGKSGAPEVRQHLLAIVKAIPGKETKELAALLERGLGTVWKAALILQEARLIRPEKVSHRKVRWYPVHPSERR